MGGGNYQIEVACPTSAISYAEKRADKKIGGGGVVDGELIVEMEEVLMSHRLI